MKNYEIDYSNQQRAQWAKKMRYENYLIALWTEFLIVFFATYWMILFFKPQI